MSLRNRANNPSVSCTMFYYVSFLRPPPQNAHIGSAISITPQIANDLRTELLQAPQDIYFAWVTSSSGTEDIRSSIRSTKVRKLTQWRHENAYRQITVPLPSGARHGQKYRLLLVAGAEDKRKPTAIHLFGSVCDVGPFPVISMPITFSLPARSAHASGKQEQVERAYYLTAGDSPISIIVREQTSFDLDKVIFIRFSSVRMARPHLTCLRKFGIVELA